MKAKLLLMLLAIVSANCVAVTLEERIAQVETQISDILECVKSDHGDADHNMEDPCHCATGCGGGGSGGSGQCSSCHGGGNGGGSGQ